jgi:precorrin-3B C17-methyltransferase
MRQGQTTTITTLNDLTKNPVDMQTVVVVGNSQTYTYGPYMITPRGYRDKYRGQVSGAGDQDKSRG